MKSKEKFVSVPVISASQLAFGCNKDSKVLCAHKFVAFSSVGNSHY